MARSATISCARPKSAPGDPLAHHGIATTTDGVAAGVDRTVDVVVIGVGQAGLSAGYFLQRRGFVPGSGYVMLDHSAGPGGAWQHRWPSLKLGTTNHVHDLPGLALDSDQLDIAAAEVVPSYFVRYENHFALPVRRPVTVTAVRPDGAGLLVSSDHGDYHTRAVINATGTWERPFWPHYPGAATFTGRQLHTADYRGAEEFRGHHVLVVGSGISAVQLLDEISQVTATTWVSRRPPVFSQAQFSPEAGRAGVAVVERRVRAGQPPGSVVSVTGLMLTPALRAARDRGVLHRLPIFSRIVPTGVAWDTGATVSVDVILWCTGFRSALEHLAPLHLREAGGGIRMTGRLATHVTVEPHLHLLGYGPSASTIGANRAGRAAVQEIDALLRD